MREEYFPSFLFHQFRCLDRINNESHSFCCAGTPTGSVKVSTTSSSSGKTENVLPAYCNPPNPCPIGYTGNDLVNKSVLISFNNTNNRIVGQRRTDAWRNSRTRPRSVANTRRHRIACATPNTWQVGITHCQQVYFITDWLIGVFFFM